MAAWPSVALQASSGGHVSSWLTTQVSKQLQHQAQSCGVLQGAAVIVSTMSTPAQRTAVGTQAARHTFQLGHMGTKRSSGPHVDDQQTTTTGMSPDASLCATAWPHLPFFRRRRPAVSRRALPVRPRRLARVQRQRDRRAACALGVDQLQGAPPRGEQRAWASCTSSTGRRTNSLGHWVMRQIQNAREVQLCPVLLWLNEDHVAPGVPCLEAAPTPGIWCWVMAT